MPPVDTTDAVDTEDQVATDDVQSDQTVDTDSPVIPAGDDTAQPVDGTAIVEESFQSIRDAATEFGADLSGFDDDEAALRHLVERSNSVSQNEELVGYGRQYLQHAGEFQQWQVERQAELAATAAAPADDEPKFWDAPDYNPLWLNQVELDPETGQMRPVNGGTLETVQNLQRYTGYRQDQQDRFWREGPSAYMQPYLDHRDKAMESKLQGMVDHALGRDRAQASASQFVEQNQEWLYNGNATDAQTGERQLSGDGQKFRGYLEQFSGLEPAKQQQYAMQLLEADRVLSGQQTPEKTREAENKKILMQKAGYSPDANKTDTTKQPSSDGVAPPLEPGQSLKDLMTAEFQAAGITNEDISARY